MNNIRVLKKGLPFILILIVALFILNNLIFSSQLNYGFRDIDWEMLYYYKIFGKLSFDHLISAYKLMGAYTYELYYVGFLETILGLNFNHLHQATQIFKILSGLGIYFLVIIIFRNKLLGVLSSLIYTINYTHAGAMFMLATGGYFFASIFMSLFLITYYFALTRKGALRGIVVGILLALTLILNTERMYPLIFLVILVELIFIIANKFNNKSLNVSSKRIFSIFLPLIIFTLIYIYWPKSRIINIGFSPNNFFTSVQMRMDSILKGNWQLFLYPFASLGSMFLYGDLWKYLGQVNFLNFSSYITSFIFGILLKLGVVSSILLFFISKKPFKQVAIILSSLFIFGMIIYWVFNNWKHLENQIGVLSVHFDPNLIVVPALFGFFIIMLTIIFLTEWVNSRNNELIPLIVGSSFTLIFIILTWMASDIQLLFMGPHRYLSIPSIGISLFISGILVIFFNRLNKGNFTRLFAWIVLLLPILLIAIDYHVANEFFNYELSYAGMRGKDQLRMKNTFYNLAPNIDKKEQSLFYFDETPDEKNGYFDESTILAGFGFWTQFNSKGKLNSIPNPGMLRANIHCPEISHKSCLEVLKKTFFIKEGVKGFLYKDIMSGLKEPTFYKLSNFYALRFINKDIADIRNEVIKELGINE